ncbi:MAG: polysaccharide lyase, partial [Actinomycetota bacterium]|nr:polysaccharide lyase [Actinomycetota bacterium]
KVDGSLSAVEVWLDGVRVNDLSMTLPLGTNRIGELRLGEHASGRTYDLAFDDVIASSAWIATAPAMRVFSDDFETGNLSRWSSSRRMTVQTAHKLRGTYGARATGTGSYADATRILSSSLPELYYRSRFKIISQGANQVTLMGMRAPGGGAMLSVSVNAKGMLTLYNGITAKTLTSTTAVGKGTWHDLQLHVRIAGTGGLVEVWLDGTKVSALSGTISLGTNPIGQLRLGEHSTGRTYDVAFDDVEASQSFMP